MEKSSFILTIFVTFLFRDRIALQFHLEMEAPISTTCLLGTWSFESISGYFVGKRIFPISSCLNNQFLFRSVCKYFPFSLSPFFMNVRNHAYSGPCFATQQAEVPVVCSACRADGQIWAQACSYDWGRGASGLNMVDFAEIHLKSVEVNDVFSSSDGDQSSRAGSSHNQSFSHNNSWEQQNRGWNGQNRHNSSSSHQGYENQNYKKNNYSNNRKWNSGGGYGSYQ